jgi:nucleotide-binding universal stress UspA family protein
MSATVQAPGPVLVGVDGSTRNASAVAWAAAEAASSSAPLVLVHDGEEGEAAGRATLERAAAAVASVDRALRPVTQVLTAQGAAAGLVRTARELERTEEVNSGHNGAGSATLVVGRRGAGGFRAMALGSTARLLAHEVGPATVIVPSDWEPATVEATAPVVVDARFESGEPGERAVAAAMARAFRDGRPVVAVSVWTVPAEQARAGRSIAQVWSEHADRAERELEDRLQPWRTAYPSVKVVAVATDRHPVAALLDQATGSELLVVPRGPTASAVVEYAECPVAVV